MAIISPTAQRVHFWRIWAAKQGFQVLSRVAVTMLCMHPTACACERNWSAWGQVHTTLRSRLAVERAR